MRGSLVSPTGGGDRSRESRPESNERNQPASPSSSDATTQKKRRASRRFPASSLTRCSLRGASRSAGQVRATTRFCASASVCGLCLPACLPLSRPAAPAPSALLPSKATTSKRRQPRPNQTPHNNTTQHTQHTHTHTHNTHAIDNSAHQGVDRRRVARPGGAQGFLGERRARRRLRARAQRARAPRARARGGGGAARHQGQRAGQRGGEAVCRLDRCARLALFWLFALFLLHFALAFALAPRALHGIYSVVHNLPAPPPPCSHPTNTNHTNAHHQNAIYAIGGSVLASLSSFQRLWVSRAEYLEHGAGLIHTRSP